MPGRIREPIQGDGWNTVGGEMQSRPAKNQQEWYQNAGPSSPRPKNKKRGRKRASGRGHEALEKHATVGTGWGKGNGWETTGEDGWLYPADPADYETDGDKPRTMEEVLEVQGHLYRQWTKDLIPFWLHSVDAAAHGEPEVKLESYIDELIEKQQSQGWYWTPGTMHGKEKSEVPIVRASGVQQSGLENPNLGWGEPPSKSPPFSTNPQMPRRRWTRSPVRHRGQGSCTRNQ